MKRNTIYTKHKRKKIQQKEKTIGSKFFHIKKIQGEGGNTN